MSNANLVTKRVRMGHRDIIKYQLITECFINQIHITNAELDCLAQLGAYGEYDMADFCNSIVDEKIFSNSQTVRNFLNKASKNRLILKEVIEGSNKKKVKLNPIFSVQTVGSIMLDYKIAYVTQE
jgi:hypothetical protein